MATRRTSKGTGSRRREGAKPRGRTKPRAQAPQIAILSRNARLHSTRRLIEAIRAAGHRPLVLDTLRCNLVLDRTLPRMIYRGEELQPRGIHVVIPRIGASVTGYGLSVVRHFDMMGVPVVGNAIPIARSRDKMRALQFLARFGVEVPRTVMCRYRDEVPQAVEMVGGLPCIIKLLRGTQGVGVMIANSAAELEGMLDTLWRLGQEILLQELVEESRGVDVRAMVIGDRVVAAMRRRARAGEFRSNIHRGGEAEPLELPRDYAEAAVKATRVIGLEIAGVDMLETRTGPMILEVNSSPGFEGLEAATGIDIATPYVRHAIDYANARQAGYGGGHLV